MSQTVSGQIIDRRANGSKSDIDFTGGNSNAIAERSMMDVAQTRAAQEVQAAMVIAKKFPRNQTAAWARIMDSCKRPTLAEKSQYAYPRGGQTVNGPSIRLAEVLAQQWGNIEAGVVEIEQRFGESVVMAYAWDLETNMRDVKVFTVKHERHVNAKGGGKTVTKLSDPRDVYENMANYAARRKRACILAIMPGDVVEAAIDACDKTLEGQNDKPLSERIRAMAAAFAGVGVTQAMLEARLQHRLDACIPAEVVQLGKIFNAIRDGHGKPEDYFDAGKPESEAPKPTNLAEKVAPPPATAANPESAPPPAESPKAESKPAEPIPERFTTESPEAESLLTAEAAGVALLMERGHAEDEAKASLAKARLITDFTVSKRSGKEVRAAVLNAIAAGRWDIMAGRIAK